MFCVFMVVCTCACLWLCARAQSGRATCKGACKQKIEKGVLRFGSCSEAAWDGEQTHYRNMKCITAKVAQNALAFYGGDITQLRGWDGLIAADQDYVRARFDELASATPAEKPKKERSAGTPGKLGITGVGGGWYSSGEGFSPMAGLGLSYRPLEVLQLDLEGGAYLSSPLETRTDGGFGRVAVSYIHGLGGIEVSGGIQANLLLAEDLYTMPNGDQVEASYSGLVAGLHGGAALTLGSGHQVGARFGYMPFVIEGDVLVYLNTMTDLYFRYSF